MPRVVVVTGGGGGIGSAAAIDLARLGFVVVAMDPGVGVEGEPLGEPTAAETIRRIETEGGTGRASTVSVTDLDGVRELFQEVVDDLGSLDAVVNTAGILRFSSLRDASGDDWHDVLEVHLNGYLNILAAALPHMVEAGAGRIVGFTSGVGLTRTMPGNGAYACAKRAVAALTWELAGLLPPDVTINALSPIAASRMVRQTMIAGGANPSGLDLTSMPQPEEMGPAAAYLVSDRFGWCRGQVIFSGGSELCVIAPPRMVEVVRTEDAADFAAALGTIVPVVLGPAEERQATTGGSNPRFGPIFDRPEIGPSPSGDASGADNGPTCAIVSDDPTVAAAVGDALSRWGGTPIGIGSWQPFAPSGANLPGGFDATEEILAKAGDFAGPLDALIVLPPLQPEVSIDVPATWEQVIADHADTARRIATHAGWLRAATRYATASGHPLRVVLATKATDAGGRSTAQAVAQMARCANDFPSRARLEVFSISIESDRPADTRALGDLIARLVSSDDVGDLKGAELAVAQGWVGLRAHPSPIGTVSFGGPAIPGWVDAALQEVIGR